MRKDKQKSKEYLKQWKLKNPDKVRRYKEKKKEYYLRTKDHHIKKSKEWRLKNPEKVKGYMEKYKKNNPEKVKQSAIAWTKRNPEKVLANRRRYILEHPNFYKDFNKRHPYRKYKKYGVNIEEIAKKQQGKCAICGLEKKLCVDHCHKELKIRGLLCVECNAGLGSFYDNVDFLNSAITYLKLHYAPRPPQKK